MERYGQCSDTHHKLFVAGMKVSGKRRITCPPHMAYGSTIPPNSSLVFQVERKGVN